MAWYVVSAADIAVGCRRCALPTGGKSARHGSCAARVRASEDSYLGYNPRPIWARLDARAAQRESGGMVDALVLEASGVTRESSNLSFRTIAPMALMTT